MRAGSMLTAAGIAGALACLPRADFECLDDPQCTHLANGQCELDGRCSYPDDDCASGRRYSEFAAGQAGACVDPAVGTTQAATSAGSATDSGEAGSTAAGTTGGPLPADCAGVPCSDHGTCVMVDDAPTCACDAGWYSVGVQCLEDPCATTACYFVDAAVGDDAADGSRETPWQTLDRLEDALGDAQPGDHYLLRRGRTWDTTLHDGRLDITSVTGALDVPIVIGAYGPVDEAKPQINPGVVRVANAEHVVVRDLWIQDDSALPEAPNRPCLMVENSIQVAIVGNDLVACTNRGIRLHDDTEFTVIADNVVRDVEVNQAVFIADAGWTMPPSFLGAHHWVIDNVVVGSPEAGIQVSMDDTTSDVKVLGNRVADTMGSGISVYAQGFVWVGGNLVARAGDETAADGEGINLNVGKEARAFGNVVFDSWRGMEVGRFATVTGNTVLGSATGVEAVRLRDNAQVQTWRDNLVLAAAAGYSVRDGTADGAGPGVDFDAHWYAADCSFRTWDGMDVDLAGWQMALMSDAASVCGDASGVVEPPGGVDPLDWDEAFLAAFVPDAAWERCGTEAGAYGCDGTRRPIVVEPIEDYFESDGFGWAGPLLVRQRYPTPG